MFTRSSFVSGLAASSCWNSSSVSASFGSSTKRFESLSTATTSSYRVTNQIGVSPSSPGWRKTGSSSRIRAYVSCVVSRKSLEYRSYFRDAAIDRP